MSQKAVALVLAFNSEGKLLLGKRKDSGKYTLPGGHLEDSESPAEAAVRELREEAGLTAQHVTPMEVDRSPAGTTLYFFSTHVEGNPHGKDDPDSECDEWKWWDVQERGLPSNLQGPPGEKNYLRRVFPESMKKAELAKIQDTPKFPKLGLPDNRREIPIIDTHRELRMKSRAMAGATRANVHRQAPLATDEEVNTFVERAHADDLYQPNPGQVTTNHGQRVGWSLGNKLRRDANYSGPLAAVQSDKQHGHNNAPLATQVHENMHQMFQRVEEKYGMKARRNLARNLWLGVPEKHRDHIDRMWQSESPYPISHPMYYEEGLAKLHNYLNNPGYRAAYHSAYGHDPETERAIGNGIKAAHKAIQRRALNVVPNYAKWARPIDESPFSRERRDPEFKQQFERTYGKPTPTPARDKLNKTEPDEVSRLLKHPDLDERLLALKLDSVRKQHLKDAVLDENPIVYSKVLEHPLFDADAGMHLMHAKGDDHLLDRKLAYLADHPTISPDHIMAFHNASKDLQPADQVVAHQIIAQHPLTPESLLLELHNNLSTDNSVREDILQHPAVPVQALDQAIKNVAIAPSEDTLKQAALAFNHQTLPNETAEQFVRMAYGSNAHPIVQGLADHVLATRPMAQKLLEEVFSRLDTAHLRPAALQNPNTKEEQIQRFFNTSSPHDLKQAIEVPNLKPGHIHRILEVILAEQPRDQDAVQRLMDHPAFGEQHLQRMLQPVLPIGNAPLVKMAIASIQPGTKLGEHESGSTYDYSHVLPAEHQKAGYKLLLDHTPQNPGRGIYAHLVSPTGEHVGALDTAIEGKSIIPIKSEIRSHLRGKGLGTALYEAAYAHAKHADGVTTAAGDQHSHDAHMLHTRLAAKHGLKYKAKWEAGDDEDDPYPYGSYKYTIKSESTDLFDAHAVHMSDVAKEMVGYLPKLAHAFEAARFMAGGNPVPLDQARAALWRHDGDIEAAALDTYGLEPTEENKQALQNVQSMLKSDQAMPPRADLIEPVLPQSQDVAEAVRRAFHDHFVFEVDLSGKHSKGTLLARDERTGTTWLLKPGSGQQSPAAGAREEAASQSAREAAFWHIANSLELGHWFSRAELIKIDGHEVAAIELLPWAYKSIQKRLKVAGPQFVEHSLQPLLEAGIIHKLAFLDAVLGNADSHGNNVMADADGHVKLIDHGSAFAGKSFDPAFDKNSFTPWYLRAWAPNPFNRIPADQRLRLLPRVDKDTALKLEQWIESIDPAQLEGILESYGIDVKPTLDRLAKIKELARRMPADLAINSFWTTA